MNGLSFGSGISLEPGRFQCWGIRGIGGVLRQGSSSPTRDPRPLLRSAMRPVSVVVVLEVLSVPTGQAPPAPPASLGPGTGVLGVCAWVQGACPATGCPSE